MTLRRERYTVYKRRVYSLHRTDDDCMFVFIDDNKLLDDKCIKKKWGYYIRPVTPDEIEDICYITPYAIYKGHKVALRGSRIAEKMAITPTSMDNENYEETMKVLGIQHEYNGEDTVFVPIKDLDIYERVRYYDRYEYFKGIYKPYKVEDYHVIIKDGEIHRYKVE